MMLPALLQCSYATAGVNVIQLSPSQPSHVSFQLLGTQRRTKFQFALQPTG
jgi:hypothetical protein